MTDIMVTGRLVSGHPLESHAKLDNNGQPRVMKDGSPMNEITVGVAIPKTGETHWNQTPWGQQVHAAAVAAWPNNEHTYPHFAWKIVDGDSTQPNRKGNKPCDREGYTGHWVVFANTMFRIPTYHAGQYDPHQQIKDANAIKRGDYVRLVFSVTGNGSTESHGIYINPVMLELSRAGVEIISANTPDAGAAFGGSVAQLPPGAQLDTSVATPAPAPAPAPQATPAPAPQATPAPAPAPAHDLVQPGAAIAPPPAPAPAEESYIHNGATYTRSALLAMPGWTEAHLATLQKA